MTISISDGTTTLALSPYLLWSVKNNTPRVSGSERQTLGNRLCVQRFGGSGGSKISLEAINDNGSLKGSFTWGQAMQFRTWSDLGQTLTLNLHNVSFEVVIPLAGGVNILAVVPKTNQPSDSLCSGTLELIEA
jgi:hypothetical protein